MARTTDKHPCAGTVTEPGGWHDYSCTRSGTIEENGKWWCRQHAPSLIAEKRAAKEAAWAAETAVSASATKEGKMIRLLLADLGVETLGLDRPYGASLYAPHDRIAVSYDAARALIARLSTIEETTV